MLRPLLSRLLPALPLRGSARLLPAPPVGAASVHRVALRFAQGAGDGEQRAAVRLLVDWLRSELVAGVGEDGRGEGGEWFVRVVGAG